MVLLHNWAIGDRVYCVSRQEKTGTVVNVLPHSQLVMVRPDGETGSIHVFPSSDLEWWTRPIAISLATA